jgi:hypothetical protein
MVLWNGLAHAGTGQAAGAKGFLTGSLHFNAIGEREGPRAIFSLELDRVRVLFDFLEMGSPAPNFLGGKRFRLSFTGSGAPRDGIG